MSAFAFRVIVTGGEASLVVETGPVPDGVYQISGHDNAAEPGNPSTQKTVAVIQHDHAGVVVAGCSGYVGA